MRRLNSFLLAYLILTTATGAWAFPGSPISGGTGTTNASDLSSGTLPAARIGDNSILPIKLEKNSGTAGATTYYRGDGAWATPSGTGTVTGPATATEDYFPVWGADNVTLKNSTVSSVNPSFNTINVTGANALNLGSSGTADGSIRWKSGTASNYSYFPIIASNFTDNVGWTLPTGAPAGNNYLLNSSTAGVLGYTDPATFSPVAGSASITTLGTVGTGTWNATAIGAAKGGTGIATNGSTGFPYVNAGTWSIENAATTRTNLGLGSSDTPTFAGLNLTGPLTSNCSVADNGCWTVVNDVGEPAAGNLVPGLVYHDNTLNCVRVRNSDNTVTYSAGCMEKTLSFGIDCVATTDNVLLHKFVRAATITQVDCYASVDNVIGSLAECASDNVTSCTAVDSTDFTVTNAITGFSANSGFENAGMAAGAWLKWSTTSVGTANNKLTCTVRWRE